VSLNYLLNYGLSERIQLHKLQLRVCVLSMYICMFECIRFLTPLTSIDSELPFFCVHSLPLLHSSLCHCIMDSLHPPSSLPFSWYPLQDLFGPSVVSHSLNVSVRYKLFVSIPLNTEFCKLIFSLLSWFYILSFLDILAQRFQKSIKKSKAVPLHAMQAHGGRGGIAPTHT
jgi:hypothetical protein